MNSTVNIKPLIPSISSKSHWVQLFFLLLIMGCSLIFFSAFAYLVGKLCFGADPTSKWFLYTIQFISSLGVFLFPALFFSYSVSKSWFSYSKADKIAPPSLVGYVLILALLILPVIACLGYFNEQISLPESMKNLETWMRESEEKSKQILQQLTANSNILTLLLNILMLALFPAVFEEFLFRGTLQPFFTKWFSNKHVAIIVTAFIFSAIHFQFYGFIPRFLLGVYLGYLLVWGKSLWLPIIAHFMHNAISLIFDYGAQQRGIDLDNLDPSQINEFYPAVLLCTFCITVGIFMLRKKAVQIL